MSTARAAGTAPSLFQPTSELPRSGRCAWCYQSKPTRLIATRRVRLVDLIFSAQLAGQSQPERVSEGFFPARSLRAGRKMRSAVPARSTLSRGEHRAGSSSAVEDLDPPAHDPRRTDRQWTRSSRQQFPENMLTEVLDAARRGSADVAAGPLAVRSECPLRGRRETGGRRR